MPAPTTSKVGKRRAGTEDSESWPRGDFKKSIFATRAPGDEEKHHTVPELPWNKPVIEEVLKNEYEKRLAARVAENKSETAEEFIENVLRGMCVELAERSNTIGGYCEKAHQEKEEADNLAQKWIIKSNRWKDAVRN